MVNSDFNLCFRLVLKSSILSCLLDPKIFLSGDLSIYCFFFSLLLLDLFIDLQEFFQFPVHNLLSYALQECSQSIMVVISLLKGVF